jgi:hypothetical protein
LHPSVLAIAVGIYAAVLAAGIDGAVGNASTAQAIAAGASGHEQIYADVLHPVAIGMAIPTQRLAAHRHVRR